MPYTIFDNEAEALALRNQVDSSLKYPKQGQDIGGGIHSDEKEKLTDHYAEVRKHPSKNLWAVLTDSKVKPFLLTNQVPVSLTEDWIARPAI